MKHITPARMPFEGLYLNFFPFYPCLFPFPLLDTERIERLLLLEYRLLLERSLPGAPPPYPLRPSPYAEAWLPRHA